MTTKTAIITGASAGLGLECARALLNTDPSWHVVLAVRSPARSAEAVAQIRAPERCRGVAPPPGRQHRRPPQVHHLEAVQRLVRLRTRPPARSGAAWHYRQRVRPRADAGFWSGARLFAHWTFCLAIPVSRAARSAQ